MHFFWDNGSCRSNDTSFINALSRQKYRQHWSIPLVLLIRERTVWLLGVFLTKLFDMRRWYILDIVHWLDTRDWTYWSNIFSLSSIGYVVIFSSNRVRTIQNENANRKERKRNRNNGKHFVYCNESMTTGNKWKRQCI